MKDIHSSSTGRSNNYQQSFGSRHLPTQQALQQVFYKKHLEERVSQ